MTIAWNGIKEKVRRKELYVICVIGILILFLFSGESGTITVNGRPVTDYESLAPILLMVLHAIGAALAIVLSLSTIPNEYERKTSHLVWIRGVSQSRYHLELALANGISALFSEGILLVGMVIFMGMKKRGDQIVKLIPVFFILALSVFMVALFTSLVSAVFPKLVAGLFAAIFYLLGVFHEVFGIFSNMISSGVGKAVDFVLNIVPNLHEIQAQAGNVLSGEAVSIHVICKGLFVIWLLVLGLMFYRKKEA